MNVTPLVDVVLVLLIIFMVVAPQLESGVSVALPSILHPDAASGALEPTTVTVTREGRLYLEKEPLELEALQARLAALHAQKPEARLVLKADFALGYGRVRSVFKTCQDLGFPGVSLQVLDRANQRG
ncbi:MAG: biopolymer transporter ExbD [Archangiaceae bacterium]|nr:biopolymer transporter ExbD [Archangiaceae bacterium]